MTVALPSRKAASATPRYNDFGGVQKTSMGGEHQRVDRLGSRWGCAYTLPAMNGDEARVWVSRLIRGLREKASYYFPQPGVTLPTPSSAVAIAASANAELIAIGSGGTYLEGTFFSVVHAGKNYVYQVTVPNTPGSGVIGIQPPLRSDLSVSDPVSFADVKIEGYTGGGAETWTVDNAKKYGLSFDIEEAA